MARRTPRTRRNPTPFTLAQQAAIDALPVWIHNAYTGDRVRPATRAEYRSAQPGRNEWDAHKRMVRLGYGESEVVGEPYEDGRPSFLDDLGLRLVTRHSKELLGTSEQGEYEAGRSQSWDDRGGVSVDRPDIPRHAVTWAGFPWPREARLYHATRALGPISREGFKTRRQGTAAMGGGRHVYSISLTLVPERAAAFALAFDTLARVAQGKMSLRNLMARLAVEAPRSFRLALEIDGDLHLLRVDPEAVSRLDEGWVFISVGDQEAWLRPENVAGWRAANPDKRVYVYDRAEVAFSLYSASLRSGFSTRGEAFNPLLMGTDMAALAKTPLSDIGIVVARTSTPRICVAAGKATTRLGYTVAGDTDRVAFSENDCERDIEDEIEVRSGGTRRAWTTPEEARSTFASRQRYAEGDPYARLDTNFEVGTRTPETVMVFNEGEEEVRIFDPSKIAVVETWDMPTIRRMFNLGDRITFPNFSSDEKDISLWPLLKDAPPMRDNPRTPRTRRNGFFASKEERERKEREKTKVERGLDTTRNVHAAATVGILATKALAPRVAATVGLRAIPYVGEVLMAAGASKEAYKVARRRQKEGWKSGSWKTDLAKVGAGAVGLEDFVPDAPKKNPLVFDNRFDPKDWRRSGSRVVASLVAPPAQRAQVARLADSPHTFRVILLDPPGNYYDNESLATLSQPGCITLLLSLSDMDNLDLRSRNKRLPKTAGLSRFSAFVFLHRMGDVLYPGIGGAVYPHLGLSLDRLVRGGLSDSSRLYFPGEISKATQELARNVVLGSRSMRGGDPREVYDLLRRYIMSHTNSQMSREAMHADDPYADAANQYIADWVALSELPSARARSGRGEPWLLFPPKPGEYPPDIEEKLKKFSEAINTYFPLFIQSLLDDLDGAVFRI